MDKIYESKIQKSQIEKIDDIWRVWAPAKINLNLHVGPLREDGFHPVDSIIAKIAFYDELRFEIPSDDKIHFSCDGIDCCDDQDNLAMQAALLIRKDRQTPGIKINLTKNIKPGRGLGGGSSDAAAVLIALNKIWKLNLDISELANLAAQLGSDVPLFLGPNASRLTSRGEIFTPVQISPFWIILITADMHCPTGQIYKQYDQNPVELAPQLDTKILQTPPDQFQHLLKNDLTPPAHQVCPPLAKLHDSLNSKLDGLVKMTGSGSALFTIHSTATQAAETFKKLPQEAQKFSIIVPSNPW